jgi:eukaryotic-like serine/threonine-protein kinase
VVLSYVPADVIDDPVRLAALVRDVEAAGRLHHPGAVQVLGTEAAGDALAIMESFRPGETIRALLDAAGRLPPEIAARVVADACAAVASAHAIDTGEGQPLVHGSLSPDRIAVGHDGGALVSGFGAAGGGVAAADVRALAAVLHECLSGEPPSGDEVSLALPGIPPSLAEVVARVLHGEPPSAGELGRAIAGAVPLAAHAEVMAYAEAILPAARGERAGASDAQDSRASAAEDPAEAVGEAEDPVRRAPAAEPLQPPGGADAARVFAAPPPAPTRSRLPLLVAVCALAGFAVGFAAARSGLGAAPAPALTPGETANGGPSAHAAAAEVPAAARTPAAPAPATLARELPAPAAEPASPSVRPPSSDAPKSGASRPREAASVRRPAPTSAQGVLAVTAPAEAEVLLDGRPVGRGSLRREIPVGPHLIEVRLDGASVAERFEVASGETWTYEVTPTP